MPRYEYRCTACDQDLEVVQSFNDAALTECPACDGKLRRVFSSVGVVFKGSGFYKTDSRSGGSGGARVKEKAAKETGTEASGKDTVGAGTSAGGGSADGSSSSAGASSPSTTANGASSGTATSSSGSGTAAA
ncbi:FmdB family zinc ribbon protein [Frankia sp. Cppng1_Ct_nod]|uniref:FmdB family zinc ribbon protein n=1 Tax=Frankia sp. Cppng1_Ct_nod TaxID=2897162 RepID=UPI0010412730|nr:FmdB family zinc ribbon protein [Frankia sp. Cppng1_Ct_nod]